MSEENLDEISPNAKPLNNLVILFLFFYTLAFFMLIIILPGGDWGWIEGWVYIISFCLLTEIYYWIINQKNPAVIRNRTKIKKTGVTKEIKKEAGSDKWIMPFIGIFAFGIWIVPGLNHRYGWTSMSIVLEIIGMVVSFIGMVIFNGAQLQNAYASKLLDINKGQKLIDTGMYAHVRHPLYSGAFIMLIGTPFALGSWFALIPAILTFVLFLVRIKFEEDMLIKGMEGYEDYRKRVKYKLIPKIF